MNESTELLMAGLQALRAMTIMHKGKLDRKKAAAHHRLRRYCKGSKRYRKIIKDTAAYVDTHGMEQMIRDAMTKV